MMSNLNSKNDPEGEKLQKRAMIVLTIIWLIMIYLMVTLNTSCTSTQSMIRDKNVSYHSTHYSKTYVGKYDTILVYATYVTNEEISFLYLQNGSVIPIEAGNTEFEFSDPLFIEEDFAIYFPNTGKRGWQRDIWEAWIMTSKKVPKYRIRLH